MMNNLLMNYSFYNPINPKTTKYFMRFDINKNFSGNFTVKLPIISNDRIIL